MKVEENKYFTHSDKNIMVELTSPFSVAIYKQNGDDYNMDMQLDVQNIFIGEGNENREDNGTKFLLQLENNEYIFICSSIQKFKTQDPIVNFSCVPGNEFLPYPYAVDTKGRYYILWGGIVLESVPEQYENDPTTYFINYSKIEKYLKIDSSDMEWTFNLNISPEEDEENWNDQIDRKKHLMYIFELTKMIDDEIIKRRDTGLLRPIENDEEAIYLNNLDIMIDPEELKEIEDIYEQKDLDEREGVDDGPAEMYIKNEGEGPEWRKINFEEYKTIQNAWRNKLGCSRIDFEEL